MMGIWHAVVSTIGAWKHHAAIESRPIASDCSAVLALRTGALHLAAFPSMLTNTAV